MSNKLFYVDIWANWVKQNVLDRGSINNIIIYGIPGAGKSYLALLLAWRLKELYGFRFNVKKDVVYTIEDMAIRSFGHKRVIIIDEGAFAADKRRSMSEENYVASGILKGNRFHQNVFIFVAQEYLALDYRIRYYISQLAHVYFDPKDPKIRYFDLEHFVDFQRVKLAPLKYTITQNGLKRKIEFRRIIAPNAAEIIPDVVETYEKIKAENYKDVITSAILKMISKKYGAMTKEEAEAVLEQLIKSKHDDLVESVQTQLVDVGRKSKYDDIIKEVARNYTAFLTDGDPQKIDWKKIQEKYGIPRSSARLVAKKAHELLSTLS